MNILFITLVDIRSIMDRDIYTDLMREFAKNGHSVFIISPVERRNGMRTALLKDDSDEVQRRTQILKIKTGNIQKTNIIEKGISTILIESQIRRGIKQYYNRVKFDLVLYSTPPITFCNAIEYVKKRDGAKTYLLLKDIFPQNAVDMGMIKKNGVKSILYNYFRGKEKKLYSISDRIGCMSQANVKYVICHNPEVNPNIVEVCPNSIEPIDMSVDEETRIDIRKKYDIPVDKKVFVYGGNLGRPQGIDFFIKCLESQKDNENSFFLVVGDGTEYKKIEDYVINANQKNLRLMRKLPKDDYDKLVGACDVGMIFLDKRFTIPNFPSRLLSYMQAKIPVLAVTDSSTDIGKVILAGKFGWWAESGNIEAYKKTIEEINKEDLKELGKNGWYYLEDNYSVNKCYLTVMEWMK